METTIENADLEQNKIASLKLKANSLSLLFTLLPAFFAILFIAFGSPISERSFLEKIFSYAVLAGPLTLIASSVLLFIISLAPNIKDRGTDVKIAYALPVVHLALVFILWVLLSVLGQ